jgi:hypothetical protein
MHKAKGTRKITLTTTDDAIQHLEQWARDNLTSLSAEMVRAVRFRAASEREEHAAEAD